MSSLRVNSVCSLYAGGHGLQGNSRCQTESWTCRRTARATRVTTPGGRTRAAEKRQYEQQHHENARSSGAPTLFLFNYHEAGWQAIEKCYKRKK